MKNLVLLLIFLSFHSFNIVAQNSWEEDSSNLDVTAESIQVIELITVSSLRLGKLQPGQLEVYVSPTTNSSAGYMIAVGTPGAEFQLNYIKTREVSRIDGEGSLKFEYEIAGNSDDEQLNSELLNNENLDIRFNENGLYYLWIGGTVDLSNAQPGSYVGDFTIEIDYI